MTTSPEKITGLLGLVMPFIAGWIEEQGPVVKMAWAFGEEQLAPMVDSLASCDPEDADRTLAGIVSLVGSLRSDDADRWVLATPAGGLWVRTCDDCEEGPVVLEILGPVASIFDQMGGPDLLDGEDRVGEIDDSPRPGEVVPGEGPVDRPVGLGDPGVMGAGTSGDVPRPDSVG